LATAAGAADRPTVLTAFGDEMAGAVIAVFLRDDLRPSFSGRWAPEGLASVV